MRELLCHVSTEKTEAVLKQAGIETGDKKRKAPKEDAGTSAPSLGHGRNGAAAYRGAQKVQVPHESLKAGDPCPDADCGGKVYAQRDPGVLVRVKGQAPIAATVYELEKLRCHLCGKVFTAAAPEGAGEKKYDESAAAMMAVLRYGSGFPWNRLEGLEENLGIPHNSARVMACGYRKHQLMPWRVPSFVNIFLTSVRVDLQLGNGHHGADEKNDPGHQFSERGSAKRAILQSPL